MTMVGPNINESFTRVQSDPGSQFMSAEWSKTCAKFGVKSRYCPVDHQAMNGQVERVQGLLTEKVRTLLTSGKLHVRYWPLALGLGSNSSIVFPSKLELIIALDSEGDRVPFLRR